MRSCGVGGVEQMVELENILIDVSYLHQCCRIFSKFFGECDSQGAVDFAELRSEVGAAEAWSGMPHVLRRGRLCT